MLIKSEELNILFEALQKINYVLKEDASCTMWHNIFDQRSTLVAFCRSQHHFFTSEFIKESFGRIKHIKNVHTRKKEVHLENLYLRQYIDLTLVLKKKDIWFPDTNIKI